MENIKATEKTIKAILKTACSSRPAFTQAFREDNQIVCTDGRILYNEQTERSDIPKGHFKLEKGFFYDANASLEGYRFPDAWKQTIPDNGTMGKEIFNLRFTKEGFTSFVFDIFKITKIQINYLEIIFKHFENSNIQEIVIYYKSKNEPFVFEGDMFKFVVMPMYQK